MKILQHRFSVLARRALEQSTARRSRLATIFIGSLAFFLNLSAQSQATVASWMDPSGFNSFAVLTNNLLADQSTINGNTGYGGNSYNLNDSTFNGNFSYTGSNPLKNSPHDSVSGSLLSNSNLSGNYSNASTFSSTIASFTPNITFNDQNQTISSITGVSQLNVVEIDAGNFNTGTITITGSANEIFYINVKENNFTAKNIVLSGGVTASNIYWNFLGSSEIGLGSGTFNGNILDFNSQVQLTNMTVNGGIYGYDPQIQETTVNDPACVAVPEPSTWVGLGAALGGIGMVGAGLRCKKRKS